MKFYKTIIQPNQGLVYKKKYIMAHFAKIDENNIVQEIIVISNDDCQNLIFPESETIGQNFIASIGLAGTWKQTSYNSTFRKKPNDDKTYVWSEQSQSWIEYVEE